MLKIDLEVGDSVRIGEYAVITLEEKSGQRARIAFQADRSIPIKRVRGEAASPSRIAAEMGIGGKLATA